MNLSHIESRRSKRVTNEVEIYAECNCSKKEFNELVQHLKDHVNIVSYNTPQHVWSAETGKPELRIAIVIMFWLCNNVTVSSDVFTVFQTVWTVCVFWVACQMGKEYRGFPKRSQSWTNALIEC